MLPQEIITQKREGEALSEDAIAAFCQGLSDGSWGEGQIAALAMAICCRGMDSRERVALTMGMRDSGDVLEWASSQLDGPVLDKHSTGGVGDGVSLVLGPMLAACGCYVPMISGRGLGHTGGTLDKLESIPGYTVTPSVETFQKAVESSGVAIVGQTAALAPADGRLYAVRDITATVESLDLITASILSKKLAAGLHGLVMDVKVGNGAFMPTEAASRELAQTLVEIATDAGLPTVAVLTNMSECLSASAGNALEVCEAIRFLKGEIPSMRFKEVVMALGAELLGLGGVESDQASAKAALQASLDNGKAFERFDRMVRGLGGGSYAIDQLPVAPVTFPCLAPCSGVVSRVDVKVLGTAIVELGGGRRQSSDAIDHAVGLSEVAGIGRQIDRGEALAIIHARSKEDAARVSYSLREVFTISETVGTPQRPVVLDRISRR
jgi:thymidine phosphorylase